MIGKITTTLGLLFLAWVVAACGTIEVTMADNDAGDVEELADANGREADVGEPTPTTLAVETPQGALTATPFPLEQTPETGLTPSPAAQDGPADWQRFYDGDNGIELWYPPGTTAVLRAIIEGLMTMVSPINVS